MWGRGCIPRRSYPKRPGCIVREWQGKDRVTAIADCNVEVPCGSGRGMTGITSKLCTSICDRRVPLAYWIRAGGLFSDERCQESDEPRERYECTRGFPCRAEQGSSSHGFGRRRPWNLSLALVLVFLGVVRVQAAQAPEEFEALLTFESAEQALAERWNGLKGEAGPTRRACHA